MNIETGKIAPDFELMASNGEKVTLSNYRGKNVVLYFYPKDMTPGCTTQGCDFRDHHESFEGLDCVILGISIDSLQRHQKFIEKYNLPFLLLVDEEHTVAEMYGVWKLKKNFGKEYMGIERSTFIIDREGKLVKEWRKVKVKGHVEDALKFLQENL
ncbi:thioredoxin-dependent thiol peroxidase [Bacillus cereus]|uniref:thioredoxin-dependent thiol peroxidase n=1 Tax=Bacillus TaxID=1386 RepID=UPI0018CE5B62|nr:MULTISPECIES: thioredoxin-dependent thiol peroxidase [Bacillus cereus group]MBG9521271.1 peroxiredoxin [Bacillus thuringiensis]MCC2362559.1 thioredoxin-dependent thiol peroxidase [Bacillus cereus]MED3465608.1 thioredoxin-dependent thiol peroxidase [Bacillus thuringiensis]HDR3895389.1 thioredoxin-dependent thiol peroxidase [Bacillus cereus]HDR7492589.1 thioredoxin-dependent thiol peroxidase [Bacillus cereus]